MLILALLFAIAVAALHYRIFFLELPAYGQAAFRRIFGIREKDIATLKSTFNHLAVYNLALAANLTIAIFLHLFMTDSAYLYGIANGLLFASLITAMAAGGYLAYNNPEKRKIAAFQAVPALLSILCLSLA
ncbi:DUF1304 family protein [Wielerella bovis]|uniref:DUF1304 family protein n=1 Tax=Wielerella bovis TaxID=2917790 RepID=UPI002018B8D6|nr:DUF1304 family protein [Wielerella bovis]ULJ60749.1 DUF1304 domain-containing protein [Wielerella bovis]ULJ65170.1 DUF1304 domain-containing protein [Wielerella bovis]ULJ67443.1 DUF1304 domain-containing protein [Wielerella bovis]